MSTFKNIHSANSNDSMLIPPPIEPVFFAITKWDAHKVKLNKSYTLNDENILKKSGGNMSSGSFNVVEVKDLIDLNNLLNSLKSNQAVSIGLPHSPINGMLLREGRVTSRDKSLKDAIHRTKEYMQFSNCFIFDIDGSSLTLDEVIPALCQIDPSLIQAPILIRPSSSYGIRKKGDDSSAKYGSYHIWIGGVVNSMDIARYGKTFASRCWLKGWGEIKVSKSGALLERQLIDAAVFSPERLVFESKPSLGKGLVQDHLPYLMQAGLGSFDTQLLLDLTVDEQRHKDRLVQQAKQLKRPEGEILKVKHIKNRVEQAVKQGIPANIAEKHITASLNTRELYSSQSVKFDQKGIVSIADILKDPSKFDGCTMADPVEWDQHSRINVAKFYANDGKPVIHSFAHGGSSVFLKRDPEKPNSPEMIILYIKRALKDGSLSHLNIAPWIIDTSITFDFDTPNDELLLNLLIEELKIGKQKTVLKKEITRLKKIKTKAAHVSIDRTKLSIQTDLSKPLNTSYFPDIKYSGDNMTMKATEGNLTALLNGYRIEYHYDVISKEQILSFPKGDGFCADMQDNARLQRINSLCNLNELPPRTTELLTILFASKAVNPVIDYISDLVWDGKDHVSSLIKLVQVKPDSVALWDLALKRWLIQCVASADYAKQTSNELAKKKFEYCLILVGDQGIAKSSFFQNLIPKKLKHYLGDGMSLQIDDKDSVKQAVSKWISELGEIDSTFTKSSNARLKAFLSKAVDEMRLPYDRASSTLQRRTSFCGTVNNANFLSDQTGSRRFWPIDVESLPLQFPADFDVDQLWAHVWALYVEGEQWWDDDAMRLLVDEAGKLHTKENEIREQLLALFDLEAGHSKGRFIARSKIRELINKPNKSYVIDAITSVITTDFGKELITVDGSQGYRLKLK